MNNENESDLRKRPRFTEEGSGLVQFIDSSLIAHLAIASQRTYADVESKPFLLIRIAQVSSQKPEALISPSMASDGCNPESIRVWMSQRVQNAVKCHVIRPQQFILILVPAGARVALSIAPLSSGPVQNASVEKVAKRPTGA